MKIVSHGLTAAGRGHAENEDAFLADDEHALYAVSDGVGRYKGAALASRLVVETVARELRGPAPGGEAQRAWLVGAAKKAAKALAAEAKKARERANMAATLTLMKVIDGERHLLHVGDSRAYLWSEDKLVQLTRDHSVAFEQYEVGAITKDQLRTHPNQKLLTRTLRASSSIVIPELGTGPVRPGERYLLCSDGLTKELTDEQIAEILRGSDVSAVARVLVDAAAGGDDDVTVVLVDANP